MIKLDINDFLNEVKLDDEDDTDVVIESIRNYLEDLGYDILSPSEDPNDRFLNQDPVIIGYSTTEWFGQVRTDPEYDDSYDEYITTWVINSNEYIITEYIDSSGNNCFKVE